MPSTIPQRRLSERSISWPLPARINTETSPMAHKSNPRSTSAVPLRTRTDDTLMDSDIQFESTFFSPINMYEYEDWASDSDDDAEEIEWDAGITDFALFDSDRRRAQERHEPLPSRWNDMIENQTWALQRAVERNRANSSAIPIGRQGLMDEDIPNLTPDNSPSLRDDLDIESYYGQSQSRPSVPNYLTINVTPPEEDKGNESGEDGYYLPLSFYVNRERARSNPDRKLERPGLQHSRTMSGQVHAWRKPDTTMYTVGEEPDAERKEELCVIRRIDSGNDQGGRGRGRSRR